MLPRKKAPRREGKGREGKGPTRSLPPCPNLIFHPVIYPTGIGRSRRNRELIRISSCFLAPVTPLLARSRHRCASRPADAPRDVTRGTPSRHVRRRGKEKNTGFASDPPHARYSTLIINSVKRSGRDAEFAGRETVFHDAAPRSANVTVESRIYRASRCAAVCRDSASRVRAAAICSRAGSLVGPGLELSAENLVNRSVSWVQANLQRPHTGSPRRFHVVARFAPVSANNNHHEITLIATAVPSRITPVAAPSSVITRPAQPHGIMTPKIRPYP